MLSWLHLVNITSQILRCQDIDICDISHFVHEGIMGLIMRDFDQIRISLLMVHGAFYEDQEQWKAQNKTLKSSFMFSSIKIMK